MNSHKKFPAFGKQLMDQRMGGKVPDRSEVFITFDWNLAKAFTHVVITDDVPVNTIELRYLAGLDVTIAYVEKHANRVLELAQAILAVNPRILNTLNLDIPKSLILKNSAGEVTI